MNKENSLKKLGALNILYITVFILGSLDIIFLFKINSQNFVMFFLLIIGIINSQSRYFKNKKEIKNGKINLNKKINISIVIVSIFVFCLLIINLIYILN
ncbi:hypothetical protein [Apilactobacillus micheneri]|uniref:hypothetical protein n=1 Tax=Apilactobacillus micheneri TaxID=1899430 RepID=UPI000D023A23|nr:hypothetical protein [Apilactobacillus micheneri]TPR37742.1 hypothetical protein DY116_00530 [Apilactobacillus micheneri]